MPSRGFPGTSTWEEDPGKTQEMLEDISQMSWECLWIPQEDLQQVEDREGCNWSGGGGGGGGGLTDTERGNKEVQLDKSPSYVQNQEHCVLFRRVFKSGHKTAPPESAENLPSLRGAEARQQGVKMLLSLTIFQMVLAPVLMGPSMDHWDAWDPYGECSRSCGSGVTMRTRRCITQRTDGGHNCVGPEKSYRSCNIQDCPEGSRDFREEQCSQFDGTDFQGKRYKWLPYYRAENPCQLNCMPRGENFYYCHRSTVVDGTPCHPGRRDICVNGVCKRLGCDNMLESPQQEDACLQCGGNGQSCHLVKNTFAAHNLPKGYNQMFIIPVGATTISIRETVATRNYLAVKNLRGEYYLNGHWVIEFSQATPIAGTMLYYQRGAEGENIPETIIGRGPTTEPLVVELISQEPNKGVEYEFYLPNGRSREGYYWSYGSWSACSRECGSGQPLMWNAYQSRVVFCTIDNESYPDYLCASLRRPQSNRTCNPHHCPQTNSWKTGEWSSCSVTCGGGSQTRSVQCISHDASGPRVVEDVICAAYAKTPPSLQTCNMQTCAEYQVTGWSECSVTCGSGEQTRDVTCVGSGGTRLEETFCSTLLRPPASRPCDMHACLKRISWHVGGWGLCSQNCGSGSRARQVICTDQQRNLYPVDQCTALPKPSTVERCNTQPCDSPQVVPSVQDQRGQSGFHVPDHDTVHRPESADPTQTNTDPDPPSFVLDLHCSQSQYGCCPDGSTAAGGPQGLGCTQSSTSSPVQPSCIQTSYGCCQDGVTAAQGPDQEGCQQYVAPSSTAAPSLPTENAVQCRMTTYGCCYDRTTPAGGPNGEGCPNPPNYIERSICSLPRAAGTCAIWTSRYHYDVITAKCAHFWYGGCHGNSNNFMTRAECQRACQVPAPVPAGEAPPRGAAPGRTPSVGGTANGGRSRTGGSTSAGSPTGRDRSMGRIFIVQSGSAHSGRQATSAATQAHRGRVYLHARRPSSAAASQYSGPAASLTLSGVSIDKTDPSTVEAVVGQTVVLPCRVSPPPSSTVTVEWGRDGVALSTHRHHQQPNGSLFVGPVIKSDSGWFLCVATNARERDHRYIYLSVSDGSSPMVPSTPLPGDSPVSRFSIERSGSSVVEMRSRQTARLSCTIVPHSALQSVKIEWTKNGHALNDSRITQHLDGTLIIRQLRSKDSGVYTCTASAYQQVEQKQLQLKVQADLKITTAPNNIQVSAGSTATLPCVVSGDNVNVGWSRNGVLIRADGRNILVLPDGSLILNNIKPSDEGTYTCNAYTGIYSVSATAEVTVTKESHSGGDIPPECIDQPELANCELIVYARLCSNLYYSSFCCASCTRHSQKNNSLSRRG
ncbi:papilin-like [Thalassophryne amazonica]|uniref:papilin-like n=1 Tax=Thalassophryne amazonica TaxID=390379 RepID=UPI0014718FA3|nr:papilin-like [Thalassophryne amazonica]